MKKIFITGTDLFLSLNASAIHHKGKTNSSFSVEVNFMEAGKIRQGRLTLYDKDTLFSDSSKTLLSFHGVMVADKKEPLFFAGMCEKGQGYEDCYLLVAEQEIFESSISKRQFIDLAKKYCESRNIPVYEDGNVMGEGFPFFESIPKDSRAPGSTLRVRNRTDMELYTIMHCDYFPIVYRKEEAASNQLVTCFGKFITENKIKMVSPEQVRLLGMPTFFA